MRIRIRLPTRMRNHATLITESVQAGTILFLGSVADPGPGSGAFLTPGPGYGIRNRFFPDLGSWIPNPYFWALSDKFLGKSSIILWKLAQFFSSSAFQNKKIVVIPFFVATEITKLTTTIFFHPSLLLLFLDPGPWIRDPGWLKIRIRDNHPGSATLFPGMKTGSLPWHGKVESPSG